MDDVLRRLDRLVRSWTQAYRSDDADLDEAWAELEQYLRSEIQDSTGSSTRSAEVPREVRQAFFDLEVPVGSKLEEVRRSYRRLLLRYHPDRHESDQERRRTAIEITQRLSMAYSRITAYYSS